MVYPPKVLQSRLFSFLESTRILETTFALCMGSLELFFFKGKSSGGSSIFLLFKVMFLNLAGKLKISSTKTWMVAMIDIDPDCIFVLIVHAFICTVRTMGIL